MIRDLIVCGALCAMATGASAQAGGTAALPVAPAHAWNQPTHQMLLDATRAGSRIVAVGEHGIVLLSDDDGRTYRQARQVAASATLTSVSFVDAQHGWAVGQRGVILATTDGGENWALQRIDTSIDQPLFSVAFVNARDGFAVGLWSLLLATHDGGKTWQRLALPVPPGGKKADRNLYKVFAARDGALYIAAEQGTVLRSADHGASWTYLQTGSKSSLWAGVATSDGRLFVGGLLGNLFESSDGGATWRAVQSGSSSSITDLVETRQGVAGVALDGFVLRERPGAAGFSVTQRADRAALTTVVFDSGDAPVLFSKGGALGRQ
jgi:photosystem II stability/assembly factor-like uncharacterized protein